MVYSCVCLTICMRWAVAATAMAAKWMTKMLDCFLIVLCCGKTAGYVLNTMQVFHTLFINYSRAYTHHHGALHARLF